MITLTEEDLQELREIVLQQKMDELFEEPSTYEDEDYDQNSYIVTFTFQFNWIFYLLGIT